MRWFAIGAVGVTASAASAFLTGATRDVLVAVGAAAALLLAYLAARTEGRLERSEERVDEAHRRILELNEDLNTTATMARASHLLASRPVRDRQIEEDYAMFGKPIDDAIARARDRLIGFFTRGR